MKLMPPSHRNVSFAVSLAGCCGLVASATGSEFHGIVLTRGTNKPVPKVVVQAFNMGTPTVLTPRILSTTETDARGQFALAVTDQVRAKNVSLIVTARGAKSELTNMGGQAAIVTSFGQIVATVLHPSPTDKIVVYALKPKPGTPALKPATASAR